MDVFDAMNTARAMRFYKTDPVPQELLDKVLWAATRASSPNNTQAWHFVVVRDAEQRRRLGEVVAPLAARVKDFPDPGNEVDRRTLKGAANLSASLGTVPVIIVVCGRNVYPAHQPQETMMYSAMYAASQNLVVAARAVGLGAAFTTLHHLGERQMRDILGIPDEAYIGTVIPLGFPDGPTGPVSRRPVQDVVHYDHW